MNSLMALVFLYSIIKNNYFRPAKMTLRNVVGRVEGLAILVMVTGFLLFPLNRIFLIHFHGTLFGLVVWFVFILSHVTLTFYELSFLKKLHHYNGNSLYWTKQNNGITQSKDKGVFWKNHWKRHIWASQVLCGKSK